MILIPPYLQSIRHSLPEFDNSIAWLQEQHDRGASTAILDLYLYILKKYGSEELADNCSRALLIDPARKSQLPYIMFDRFRKHDDPLVSNYG